MTVQSRYITIGGHRHRYIDTGGHGPVMLLLHGISSSLDFYRLSTPLLARSFRVLALDLLGFGQSDKPRGKAYSLQLYADLIHEFLEKTDASGNGPVYGTGHSMGGKYLLATALTWPGTFDKLVLSNTDGFITLPSFARVLSLPGVRRILKSVVTREDIAKKMFASAFHNTSAIDQETRRKILDVAIDHDAFDTVMGLNRNLMNLDLKRTGLRSRLHELKMPVLVIWGDRDRYMSPKFAHIVKQELPCAKLLIFSECGHSPMLEYPAQFSAAITEFIFQETPSADGICS
ncbi:MAG: alpha/beta hydrolase [Chlorobiaceae bacterium]|nr:alpha/beta hydrolase [Chlorobiaceae bacterium]